MQKGFGQQDLAKLGSRGRHLLSSLDSPVGYARERGLSGSLADPGSIPGGSTNESLRRLRPLRWWRQRLHPSPTPIEEVEVTPSTFSLSGLRKHPQVVELEDTRRSAVLPYEIVRPGGMWVRSPPWGLSSERRRCAWNWKTAPSQKRMASKGHGGSNPPIGTAR
jgi:hypothetical protein